MKKISLALYVLAFGIIINSCNDPSPIGSELLAEDQVDVFYTDTFRLTASTLREDSILAYDPNPDIIYDNFQFGNFKDPIFGNIEAGIYAQLIPNPDLPDFEGAILDSIVLTLQYDSSRTYGILDDTPFGVGVYRISEAIDVESKYYSDQNFQVEATPLAEISSFTPMIASTDSIKGLIDYTSDADGDTIDIAPSLRIPLSLEFGQSLINEYDSLIYTSNTNFVAQLLNGLYVKPLVETPGMLSFDISLFTSSRLTIYYRQDTIKTQYVYGFSSQFVQLNNFNHNTAGAVIDDFFNDTAKGDSLLFAQAMAGPNIKVEFPNTDALQNVIINKAELIFTVAELPADDIDSYPPTSVLIATDIDTDGNFTFLSDILLGGASFGGIVIDEVGSQGESIKQYTMNISSHFQDIIDGRKDHSIYLRTFPKQEKSSRSVIYGPGHSTYPMKLKLAFTKLD
ncbi:MAG: hypothetical protein ACI8P3_001823 [Saprospiraceae bacterium]|jgi:hypothetical protein